MRNALMITDGSYIEDVESEKERADYAETALTGAIESLLWSELDDNGEPFDNNHTVDDINVHDVRNLSAMLAEFVHTDYDDNRYPVWLAIHNQDIEATQFGHDFILTANGHGAGYWDRGYGKDGEYLTDMCKPYGDISLYKGDDGKLYISGV